jgi:hypothetical protein
MLGFLFLALPAVATSSFAFGGHGHLSDHRASHQNTLSLSLAGETVNSGTQQYNVDGGQLLYASIMGEPVNVTSAQLEYSYQTTVTGLSTQGMSALQLTGTTVDGQPVSLVAQGAVMDMIPAADLPLGCTVGVDCASAIPALFLGVSQVSASVGSTSLSYQVPTEFESPYLNPWGGPIFMASTDNSFVIVATYSRGTIAWRNVGVSGVATGTFNGKQVSGDFTMKVNSYENLVTGVEFDRGSLALSAMSSPKLDMSGRIVGMSTIPIQGAYSCASQAMPAGTCTVTGLTSSGVVTLSNHHMELVGTYETSWDSPALAFTSTVNAQSQAR